MDRLTPLLLWFALLPACAVSYTEVGRALPEADGLEIGVTTQPEVLARLGPPHQVETLFDGELHTWRILRGRRRSFTLLPVFVRIFFWEDSRLLRDDLSLLFDPDGRLLAVGERLEATDADGRSCRPLPLPD